MAKEHKNKFFSCDYDHYNIVKFRRNVNFEVMDTGTSTQQKMKDFDYCEEHLRSISNKIF